MDEEKLKSAVITVAGAVAQQVRANDPELYKKLLGIQKDLSSQVERAEVQTQATDPAQIETGKPAENPSEQPTETPQVPQA